MITEQSRRKQYEELRQLRTSEPFKSILRGWTIYWRPGFDMQAQVYINEPKKQAYICEWGPGRVPSDYIMHELLHVTFRAIYGMPQECKRLCEEFLIEYICHLVKKRKGFKIEFDGT